MDFHWIAVSDGRIVTSYANRAGSGISLRVYRDLVERGFSYMVYDRHASSPVPRNDKAYPTEEEARSEAEKAAERHLARLRRQAQSPDQFRD